MRPCLAAPGRAPCQSSPCTMHSAACTMHDAGRRESGVPSLLGTAPFPWQPRGSGGGRVAPAEGTARCAVEEPSPVPGSTPCSRPAAALRALAQRSAGVTHRSHQQPSPSAHLRLQDSAVHQRRESGLECVQRGLSCVPIAVHPSPCCVCCRMGLHTSVQSAGCVEMAGKVLPTPASIRGTEQLLE